MHVFSKIIKHYKPLLASEESTEPAATQSVDQQTTKRALKRAVMGSLENAQCLKLSDFIDKKFLEDLDAVEEKKMQIQ